MKSYKESIVCKGKERCYLCGSSRNIEIHHIFSGAFRKKSTKYGLVVPLCRECHTGTNGVHFNREKMLNLRKIGQRAFQREYPNIDFIKEFGRNYLDENDQEQEMINLEDLSKNIRRA